MSGSITDFTTSVNDIKIAFENLMPGSHFQFKASSDRFYTKGEGVATENFFIGSFITSELESIRIQNLEQLVITLPQKGQFTFHSKGKTIVNKAGYSGSMVCGVEEAIYDNSEGLVQDLLIVLDYQDLIELLDKKYGLRCFKGHIHLIDQRIEKVRALFHYVNSTLEIIATFAGIQNSLIAKLNLKHITMLIVTDLIGDLLKKKYLLNNSPDKKLVLLAEEIMETNFQNISTIQEISDQVNTSPRNLQKAFKKHRDYSPLQFLKEQKLIRANQLLHDPYFSAPVKNVAFSVGIFDINRFSKYYFDRFGEYPSEAAKKRLPD